MLGQKEKTTITKIDTRSLNIESQTQEKSILDLSLDKAQNITHEKSRSINTNDNEIIERDITTIHNDTIVHSTPNEKVKNKTGKYESLIFDGLKVTPKKITAGNTTKIDNIDKYQSSVLDKNEEILDEEEESLKLENINEIQSLRKPRRNKDDIKCKNILDIYKEGNFALISEPLATFNFENIINFDIQYNDTGYGKNESYNTRRDCVLPVDPMEKIKLMEAMDPIIRDLVKDVTPQEKNPNTFIGIKKTS
jgi:hypothetical protein